MKSFISIDDKGFSLVELIVIVLIIGIIGTGAYMSFTSVYYADAERATKEICNFMDMARTKAIALDGTGQTVKVKITKDSKDNYYIGVYSEKSGVEELIEPAGGTAKLLSKYKITLYTGTKNTDINNVSSCVEVTSSNNLEFAFKKATGEIISNSHGLDHVDLIVKGSDSYKIIIVPATGRCYLDN